MGLESVTCAINALPVDWNSFVSSIYSRQEVLNCDEFWSPCISELILKVKYDTNSLKKSQAFASTSKEKKGKFIPHRES